MGRNISILLPILLIWITVPLFTIWILPAFVSSPTLVAALPWVVLTKGGGEIFTQDLCLLLYHVEVCDYLVITLELLGTHFYLLTMFSTRPFKYRL